MAELTVGSRTLDLMAGDQVCDYYQTTRTSSTSENACADGLVIQPYYSSDNPVLRLSLTMEVRRAIPPFEFLLRGDNDGDGWTNNNDNCPFTPNDRQNDALPVWQPNGVGDCYDADPDDDLACGEGTGDQLGCDWFNGVDNFYADSDLDERPDYSDNCMWVANPDQEDDNSPAGAIVDGSIGDACEEQVATVLQNGSTQIELEFSLDDFTWTENTTHFFVVDFNFEEVLDCNWDAGTCALDTDSVQACLQQLSAQNPVILPCS
jgi:hypothetical protein